MDNQQSSSHKKKRERRITNEPDQQTTTIGHQVPYVGHVQTNAAGSVTTMLNKIKTADVLYCTLF